MNIDATLLGQAITFMLLVWFTMKFIWPPLIKALDGRAKTIADGLAAAERGRHDLELAAKRSAETLRDAKQQAQEIIAQAEKRAAELIEQAKHDARTEGGRLIAGAKADIEQEVVRAKKRCVPKWLHSQWLGRKRSCGGKWTPRFTRNSWPHSRPSSKRSA